MLAAEIESRLYEWSRWSRSYGRRRHCCGSLEGNFRSPQHWAEAVPRAFSMPINAVRCLEVEHAVTSQLDPYQRIIILVYLLEMPHEMLARNLRRWRVSDPRPVLDEAKQRVGAALQFGWTRIPYGRVAFA